MPYKKATTTGGKQKLQAAKEYLLVRPYARDTDIMQAADCGKRTAGKARALLIREGKIPRSDHDRLPREDEPDVGIDIEGAEVLKAQLEEMRGETGGPLNDEEAILILSRLVRKANAENNNNLLISAIGAHAKIKSAQGSRDALGPGPPLTEEDKIERVYLILDVAGPEITAAAAHRAFEGDDNKMSIFCNRVEDWNPKGILPLGSQSVESEDGQTTEGPQSP